jgi:hypothetical protein
MYSIASALSTPLLLRAVCGLRPHSRVNVSIRQHTSAMLYIYVSSETALEHTSAYVSIRQLYIRVSSETALEHTSAYVSIRQLYIGVVSASTPASGVWAQVRP